MPMNFESGGYGLLYVRMWLCCEPRFCVHLTIAKGRLACVRLTSTNSGQSLVNAAQKKAGLHVGAVLKCHHSGVAPKLGWVFSAIHTQNEHAPAQDQQ